MGEKAPGQLDVRQYEFIKSGISGIDRLLTVSFGDGPKRISIHPKK